MKQLFVVFIAVIIFFSIFTGCELFMEEIGDVSINGHTLYGSYGKFTNISLWWNWADEADNHALERAAPDDGQGFIEIMWGNNSSFEDNGWGLHRPDEGFIPGHRYVYRVRGNSDEMGKGPWSSE